MLQVELSFSWGILHFGVMLIFSWTMWTCRYFILKLVSLEASLRAFFQKVWIYMQQQHQMQKRAVGELTVLERILVLPKNMKLVWVTCIVLLGWKTGMQNISVFLCMLYEKETRIVCKYQVHFSYTRISLNRIEELSPKWFQFTWLSRLSTSTVLQKMKNKS